MHIALNNGFPSAKAFNKTFKEVYNQTPVEYRSLHQNHVRTLKNMLNFLKIHLFI